jgi:hypothetical protein
MRPSIYADVRYIDDVISFFRYAYLWDSSIGNWSTSKTVRNVEVMSSGGMYVFPSFFLDFYILWFSKMATVM